MLTFVCQKCGQERTAKVRRCYPCTTPRHTEESKELIRMKLKGVKHTDERRRKNSEARKKQNAEGHRNFDLAAYMRGRPHPFAASPGDERVVKDGRVQVKCDDGKWRYRSRLVWAEAFGPITSADIIHHRDFNPMNDDLSNLQKVTRGEHMKIHHHGGD